MAVRFVKQFSGCQPFHCELLKIKIFSVPNGTLKNGQRSFRCVGQTHFTTDEKIIMHKKYAVYSRFAGTTYYPLTNTV